MSEIKYKETIPLWLAVAITVVIAVPFGLWLGNFNFTLWVCFVTWAEYFALGAKPEGLKIIIPAFAFSAIMTGITMWLVSILTFLPKLVVPGDLAVLVGLFIGVAFMVYAMRWSTVFQKGSLPFFNGIAMVLGVYFTGSGPKLGLDPSLAPIIAACWAILMGIFGGLLGVLNIWLTFTKPVKE